jgi:glyoxylase-like metal-dependent hydrolase (beta-lactamase superfamily II)
MTPSQVVPVVMDVELPPGVAGPEPMTFDVRCFMVPHEGGVTLVDTGIQADAQPITDALVAMGAGWEDVSDVVLTHAHPDHCGALSTVASRAPSAVIWGGIGDTFPIAARPAEDRTLIHGLKIVPTPGHTPGHLCLLDEDAGILFTGDAICSQAGRLTQGPQMFIADAHQAGRSLQRLVELQPDRMLFGHGDEVVNPLDALANFVKP